MSRSSVFQPSPPWTNQPVRLYHGTTTAHAVSITTSGVRVAASRLHIDFGRGFYTMTLEHQARAWAWEVARKNRGRPAVVFADLDRDALAGLETLTFVRGDFHAEDFWSFVVHCRSDGMDHARGPGSKRNYDLVVGPLAAAWQRRALMADHDQISFHTPEAEAVLNRAEWRILP
jgi:hypothetical protein